jgi:hypothetical protein
MESNAGQRTLRTALTALGVLVSVAVVAVAARGSIPTDDTGGRSPIDTLVDVIFALYLTLLVLGAAFFIYLLALQRGLKRQSGIGPTSPFSTLVALAVLLIGLLAARRLGAFERRAPREEVLVPTTLPSSGLTTSAEPTATDPRFAWLPVVLFLVLLAVAALAVWRGGVLRQRARMPDARAELGEALADVLDEALDDLRAELDPRRAVIAAYARLERVLAAHGIPRRPSDAPLEYLRRVLSDLSVSPESIRRLTELFEWAKFSHHDVGAEMKDEAIAALQTIHDELRVAEALAQQEREQAATLALEKVRAAR